MNLSLPFIERPVMTTLVIAAMVIFGGYATPICRFPTCLTSIFPPSP